MPAALKVHRGAVRGDSLEIEVEQGGQRKPFRIDGKELVENPRSRFHRLDARLMGGPLAALFAQHAGAYNSGARMDAASSYALARELEFVSMVIAQQPLSDLTSIDALPMAPDQPAPFQDVYTWKQVTGSTGGRKSRSYKDIGQRGSIQVTKSSQPVEPTILHASWGIDDIARAALGGIPLPSYELQVAMRTLAEGLNAENWFGDAAAGISGIYDNGSIVNSVVPNGAGGSPLWAQKTPDEIMADINTLIVAMMTATKGLSWLRPNRLALPSDSYALLAITPTSLINPQFTILKWAEQALAAVGTGNTAITAHPELEDNGAGARWMMAYRYDGIVAGRILPVAPSFLPPDIESTVITQPVHAQGGGVNNRYPVAFQIRRGM